MMKYLVGIFALTALLACGNIDRQFIEESNSIKAQIAEQLIGIEKDVASLRQHADGIDIQGRALTTEEIARNSRIRGVEESFHQWKSQYEKAQGLLKEFPTPAENQLNGYKAAKKELNIIIQRIELLKKDI